MPDPHLHIRAPEKCVFLVYFIGHLICNYVIADLPTPKIYYFEFKPDIEHIFTSFLDYQ